MEIVSPGCLRRVMKIMLQYKKLFVGSVVPVHKIEQPPVAVLFMTEDGENVYKRVRMTKACKHCLGPQHTAQDPPCPFKEFCRVCHAHLPSLPNEGRGHCCAQGIPFDGHDKAGYDPKCTKGESPMINPAVKNSPREVNRKRKMAERQMQSMQALAGAMGERAASPDPQAEARDENLRPGKSPRRVFLTLSAACADAAVCLPPCCAAGTLRACASGITDLRRTRLGTDDFALVSLVVNDGSLGGCVFFVWGYRRSPADFSGTMGGVTGGCRGGTWGRSFERGGVCRESFSEGSRRAFTVACNTERMYGSLRSDEKRKGMRSAEGKVWVGDKEGGDGCGVWWVCVDYG